MSLVTIKEFDEPMLAHLCQAFLESHDIPSHLDNEYIAGTYWLYNNAVGGVKLQVHHNDVPRALTLLKEQQEMVERQKSIDLDVDPSELSDILCCPDCDSNDIVVKSSLAFTKWTLIYLGLLIFCMFSPWPIILAIPLFWWFMLVWVFQNKQWQCKACGYEWKARKRPLGLWR